MLPFEFSAAELLPCLVSIPHTSEKIASDNDLVRQHLQLLYLDGPVLVIAVCKLSGHILLLCGNDMVFNNVLCVVKPEICYLCKINTLVRYLAVKNNIKCGNTVCGNDYKLVISRIVYLTDLSRNDLFQFAFHTYLPPLILFLSALKL